MTTYMRSPYPELNNATRVKQEKFERIGNPTQKLKCPLCEILFV